MFGTIKGLIPEPRQADQPRNYVGRHRHGESGTVRQSQAGTATGPDAPARELAAAGAMAADPDGGADARV